MADIPVTEVYFADTSDDLGPFGAKSMSESPYNPVAPALGNAIARALGVRPYEQPFSRDRVWRLVRDAAEHLDGAHDPHSKGLAHGTRDRVRCNPARWLIADIDGLPRPLRTDEERMRLVNDLADRNWRSGNGGPFAALVAERVTRPDRLGRRERRPQSGVSQLPTPRSSPWPRPDGHRRLGPRRRRPPGHELVVNWRPCVQCYGATMWSGVRGLVVAGQGPRLEEITTFDEGPVGSTTGPSSSSARHRGRMGVGFDEALAVYRAYGASDSVVYNARGAVELTC